jgi:hypothetical protein
VVSWPDGSTAIDFCRQVGRNEFVTDLMSVQFSTARKLATAWIMLVLAVESAMAAGGYLPVTGPTPLRFEAAALSSFALPPIKSTGQVAKADDTKSVIEPTGAGTNASPQASTTPGTDAALASSRTDFLGESMAQTPMAPDSPPGEMPFITPQILAEYFKPAACSTNSAGVSVFLPAPIGFIPPFDRPPASSRATYKVQ